MKFSTRNMSIRLRLMNYVSLVLESEKMKEVNNFKYLYRILEVNGNGDR